MSIQYYDLPNGDKRMTDNGCEIGTLKATASAEALAGLQSWSKHAHPVLIFSVAQAGLPRLKNKRVHDSIVRTLKRLGVPFAEAEGCYKGEREQCFIINCDPARRYETIARNIALDYEQESVLYITAERVAFLQEPEGEQVAELGKLRVVSRVIAERARAYTFANGCYYVAG